MQHKNSFITSDGTFCYHAIKLSDYCPDEIAWLIDECESVERSNWNAKEIFQNFAAGCTDLVYVTKNERIMGFLLVTTERKNNDCILVFEEGMILKPECFQEMLY